MSYTLDFPIKYIANPDRFATIGLGKLYIGVVDGDPAFDPADRIQAYIARQNDTDLAIPQPINLTAGGVPTYLGSPVTIKINQSFSCAVLDRNNQQVYYSPKSGEIINEVNNLENLINEFSDNALFDIENVAALATFTPVAGKVYYLKEYHAGTGFGGSEVVGKAGVITPNNVTTFACTTGTYVERINYDVLTPHHAGLPLDGTTNCTTAMQKLWDAAVDNNVSLDGLGLNFRVYTISAASGQRVNNLRLESLGALTAGATALQPVVLIDGTVNKKENMIFDNVSVDGRRDLFPNVSYAFGEDGGCHAWRCVATATGGIENIRWNNCEGVNSATAGVVLHCPSPSTSDANYPIRSCAWVGGRLTGNREHGWFADSFNGITFRDVDCRFNGLDLNTTDPLEHGNRGARAAGYLFGCPFDVESYGPNFVGSLWSNITLDNLNCTGCAMPALFYNPIATNVSGYRSHDGVRIDNCVFDKGQATGADRAPSTDYSFNVVGTLTGTTYPYNGFGMSNNLFQGSPPSFTGVKGLSVSGGSIGASGVKCIISDCLYYDISAPGSSSTMTINPAANPVFTKTQGSAGASISAQTTVRRSSIHGAGLRYHVQMTITGALNADGDLIYTSFSPIAGMLIYDASVSARTPVSAAAPSSASVDVGGTLTLTIDTSASTDIYCDLYFNLMPSS